MGALRPSIGEPLRQRHVPVSFACLLSAGPPRIFHPVRCRELPHWRIPPASLPQPRGGGRNTGTRGVLALRNSGEQTGRKSGRGLKHILVVDRPLGRDPGSRGDIQIEESVCFGTAAR